MGRRRARGEVIHHLALPDEWSEALATGAYDRSTRGRSLAEEGFIHCARPEQVAGVRRRFYADVTGPLVLLTIDPERVVAPVLDEVGDPATGELFPHIHGPLPVSAVIDTTVLQPPHG